MPRGFPRLSSVKLSWVIAIGGLSLCAISTLTIISIVSPPRSWAEWLYGFQTLVAGLLALWAAAFTVIAMVIIEIRSTHRHNDLITNATESENANAQRHQEIFALNSRRDFLRIDRLRVAWGSENGGPYKLLTELQNFILAIDNRQLSYLQNWERFSDRVVTIKALLEPSLREIWNVDSQTSELFTGEFVQKQLSFQAVVTQGLLTIFPFGDLRDFANDTAGQVGCRKTVIEAAREMHKVASVLVAEMDALHAEYKLASNLRSL